MTEKQKAAFLSASQRLPDGFEYDLLLPREGGNPLGVNLYANGKLVGYVGKPGRGRFINANYSGGRSDSALQKQLLNRAAAAIWKVQPIWTD